MTPADAQVHIRIRQAELAQQDQIRAYLRVYRQHAPERTVRPSTHWSRHLASQPVRRRGRRTGGLTVNVFSWTLMCVAMLACSASTVFAQTPTPTFQWDYVAPLSTVATYQQEIRIDGVRQSAVPTCTEPTTGETTCSMPVTLGPGPHTLTVTATASGVSASATLPNVDLSLAPRPTHPRVVITITVP